MLSDVELTEIEEIRVRHTRMQTFRLAVILVYSFGLIPLAAYTILSADVWRWDLGAMLPGLVLFFGSFAFFVGVILLQSGQFTRDKTRLDHLERLDGEPLPWKSTTSPDAPSPEVTGQEQ